MDMARSSTQKFEAMNRPPPHSLRREFLGGAIAERLLQFVDDHKDNFAPNRVGRIEKMKQSINVSMNAQAQIQQLSLLDFLR